MFLNVCVRACRFCCYQTCIKHFVKGTVKVDWSNYNKQITTLNQQLLLYCFVLYRKGQTDRELTNVHRTETR